MAMSHSKGSHMLHKTLVLGLGFLATITTAGPISKFQDDEPDIMTNSVISLFDLERCLTDMEGWPVPFIYRQPDRLDEVNILWVVNAKTVGRAYLKKVAAGVEVKIWNSDGKQTRSCIETGKPR
jgi:hypothetical protein